MPTTATTSNGTHQAVAVSPSNSGTSPNVAVNGSSPVAPTTARTGAASTIPAPASATGGRPWLGRPAIAKYTAHATAAPNAATRPIGSTAWIAPGPITSTRPPIASTEPTRTTGAGVLLLTAQVNPTSNSGARNSMSSAVATGMRLIAAK